MVFPTPGAIGCAQSRVRFTDFISATCAQNAGACKLEDFGVELYTRFVQNEPRTSGKSNSRVFVCVRRQIESERQCSASAPGLDNPLYAASSPHAE